jgi:serine/threonine protein phosphatase PrpC
MEDTYIICQDLGIDEQIKTSLFAVIDGHGGDWCANFLRIRLENEIKRQLTDPVNGLKNY